MSWFDVPTTQMHIFVLFVSAGVLFYGAFSQWVSLMWNLSRKNYLKEKKVCAIGNELRNVLLGKVKKQ